MNAPEVVAPEAIEQVIARHIVNTRFEDIPAEAVFATKEHIMHTLATVLAGSNAPGAPEMMALLTETGGAPESTVLGWGAKLPASQAAMANSMMGHAKDFDNNDDRIAYKSSVCAVPASLAVAERMGATSGRDFLTAACVGIDLGIRLGLAVQPYPAHSQSPELGPFAAAASAARLLGCNEDQTWDALGLALCGVALLGVATGGLTYSKRFVAGAASRNGIIAAQLASKGFRARQPVISGPGNFFAGTWKTEADTSRLLDGLGKLFEVVNVGPKGYPSCRYTHASIDAALAIASNRDFSVDAIDSVKVTVGPHDYAHVFGGDAGVGRKQVPQSVVDAQFSIPYTVATALVQKSVFLDDFTPEAIHRPEIVAVSRRVQPDVRPEMDNWPSDVKPCVVEVILKNGRKLSQRIDYALGNPKNPVPHDRIRANFVACAEHAPKKLDRANVEQAREMIETLESVKDVREITRLLS